MKVSQLQNLEEVTSHLVKEEAFGKNSQYFQERNHGQEEVQG